MKDKYKSYSQKYTFKNRLVLGSSQPDTLSTTITNTDASSQAKEQTNSTRTNVSLKIIINCNNKKKEQELFLKAVLLPLWFTACPTRGQHPSYTGEEDCYLLHPPYLISSFEHCPCPSPHPCPSTSCPSTKS